MKRRDNQMIQLTGIQISPLIISFYFIFVVFFLILIYKGRYTLETYDIQEEKQKDGWEILQESKSSKAKQKMS